MTDHHHTVVLCDGADIEIVVPHAWSPRLRPRTMRWCRICASGSCALSHHQSITFTAAVCHPDGHWSYTSTDRWANLASRTGQTQPIEVLDSDGVVVSHDHAPIPPPDTWLWNGHICEMWYKDAEGVMQYRVGGVDANG